MERADVDDAPNEKDEEWLQGLRMSREVVIVLFSFQRKELWGCSYFEWKEPLDQEKLKMRREQVYVMK